MPRLPRGGSGSTLASRSSRHVPEKSAGWAYAEVTAAARRAGTINVATFRMCPPDVWPARPATGYSKRNDSIGLSCAALRAG